MWRPTAAAATVVILLASSGAVLSASSAAAHRAQRSRCLPHGALLLAHDRVVTAYRVPTSLRSGRLRGREQTYACAIRSGRTVLLAGHARRRHDVGHVAVGGNFAAFADTQHGIDTGCTVIGVVDVVTATTYLEFPAGCFFLTEGTSVSDLVVNEHGCVAWIAESTRFRRTIHSYETVLDVHSATPSGGDALVASGAQIAPQSLKLAPEGNITWLDAGVPQYWALNYPDCVAQ
jgi:hypothetical protein